MGIDAGGIANFGSLTILDCNIHGNNATVGAGIFNNGSLFMSDTSLSNNVAEHGGGAVCNYVYSTAALYRCHVYENRAGREGDSAGHGGGVVNLPNASLLMQDCRLLRNWASGRGGAVDNFGTWS